MCSARVLYAGQLHVLLPGVVPQLVHRATRGEPPRTSAPVRSTVYALHVHSWAARYVVLRGRGRDRTMWVERRLV